MVELVHLQQVTSGHKPHGKHITAGLLAGGLAGATVVARHQNALDQTSSLGRSHMLHNRVLRRTCINTDAGYSRAQRQT